MVIAGWPGSSSSSSPATSRNCAFYHEIDEGLWFYLRAPRLAPVPGSQPQYSDSFDKLAPLLSYERSPAQPPDSSSARRNRDKHLLLDWLRRQGRDESYLLIRDRLYERLARAFWARRARVSRRRPETHATGSASYDGASRTHRVVASPEPRSNVAIVVSGRSNRTAALETHRPFGGRLALAVWLRPDWSGMRCRWQRAWRSLRIVVRQKSIARIVRAALLLQVLSLARLRRPSRSST